MAVSQRLRHQGENHERENALCCDAVMLWSAADRRWHSVAHETALYMNINLSLNLLLEALEAFLFFIFILTSLTNFHLGL